MLRSEAICVSCAPRFTHRLILSGVVASSLLLSACEQELTGDEVDWVPIPKGGFYMGCSPGDADCDRGNLGFDETPRHWVDIEAFEMTRTEITQYQYGAVTGETPSYHPRCGNCPVEYMPNHYADASVFCDAIGGRLPSEAEWEYAARAGTETRFHCGDDASCLDDIAWYRDNSRVQDGSLRPHPVGQKAPNAFGLHDMAGNLQEWTMDCSHDDFTGAPIDGSAWMTDGDCSRHVFRGGSYNSEYWVQRSSWRYWDPYDTRGIADGFRCARDVKP
ncbi:MAG: formylglycine-generating enzyme family protein [Polyangiales bacterium]